MKYKINYKFKHTLSHNDQSIHNLKGIDRHFLLQHPEGVTSDPRTTSNSCSSGRNMVERDQNSSLELSSLPNRFCIFSDGRSIYCDCDRIRNLQLDLRVSLNIFALEIFQTVVKGTRLPFAAPQFYSIQQIYINTFKFVKSIKSIPLCSVFTRRNHCYRFKIFSRCYITKNFIQSTIVKTVFKNALNKC